MAAVLDSLAPYVKKLITDMAEEEVSMLLGLSHEITKLGDKVENLEAYVADAERRRIDDVSVQRWVNKLKGALYNATDILELCQLDAEERRDKQARSGSCCGTMEEEEEEERAPAPGCLLPLLFCLRNPCFAHRMGAQIKQLNANLDSIRREMTEFGFVRLDAYQLWRQPSEGTSHSRATTSLLDDTAVVGVAIQADTEQLVKELLTTEPGLKVVSITAAGGMGKTTLAQKIFNDEAIDSEFVRKIWLSVTEVYDPDKLLTSAITDAAGKIDPHGDKQALTKNLCATLSSTGKFLIVLDDVWSHEAWDHVLRSPIVKAGCKQPGSRVIITTRNEGLVEEMGVATYYLHRVKPLLDEDAWSLLKMQLPAQDVGNDSALDLLKHVGIQIIKKCDGLPLAIKAIGAILRSKTATELEWNGVLHDPAWKTDKTHDDLNSALRLSYEDLSPSLKQCFLYYALLPKRFWMHPHDVVGMWMSQGFLASNIEGRWNEVEDIGMSYYRDLITRNLIEKNGKMHDVIRSFAWYMAKEEALVIEPDQVSSLVSSPKIRRLSIEPAVSGLEAEPVVLPDWSRISEKQEFLTSLIICSRMTFDPSTSDSVLNRFVSLRALFLFAAESDMFARSLGILKHLRFLLLWKTDISQLPDDIGKMRFLEHIHIQQCGSFAGKIPRSMLKLERLRYLSIIFGTKFTVPKGLGQLTNLRTLQTLSPQIDGVWCSLEELEPLSRLRKLMIENLEAVPFASVAAKAKIREKEHLRDLFYACYKFYGVPSIAIDEVAAEDCQRVEEVFDQLCPPPQLEQLSIRNYIGRQPPSWMRMNNTGVEVHFNSLTTLEMWRLPLCTQLPDSLCRLPSLVSLVIKVAPAIRSVGPEFQRQAPDRSSSLAKRMSSFPKLQSLSFNELPQWEEWEWEDDEEATKGEVEDSIAMPSLQTLFIKDCRLGRLPAGLASSSRIALKKLSLWDVSRITTLDNFPSVVELDVRRCASLKIIRGVPNMRRVYIEACPALEMLEGSQALHTVELPDSSMETLPEYMRDLKPRILRFKPATRCCCC